MKKKLKKKLPFYAKVGGGNAASRPDRKAGPKVARKASGEPIPPNAPNAPVTGRVAQKFKAGGVLKRADGGPTKDQSDDDSGGLGVKLGDSLSGGALTSGASMGDTGGGSPMGAAPGPLPAPPPPNLGMGMRRGGGVKKVAGGGALKREGGADVLSARGPFTKGAKAQKAVSHFHAEHDFDPYTSTGKSGPSLGEAQTDEVGASRRMEEAFGQERPFGDKRKSGGGVLSAAQRQSLPKSSFALPGKGKGPKGAGAGSYPIPDRSHAQNALARVSQHGSSAEKATVRAKVHAKYPGMGK